MRLLGTFFRRYPTESILTLVALLFAGIAEGFGMTMLLPLLGIAMGGPAGSASASPGSKSALEKAITGLFDLAGIPPTISLLLTIFVLCIMVKAVLVLLANKRVGYMVARVATDLRLALIRALFATRWEYYVHQPIGRFTNAFATEARRSSDAYLFGIRLMALGAAGGGIRGCGPDGGMAGNPDATLLAGFIILYALRRLVKKAKKAGKRQTHLLKSLLSQLTDTLQSIKPLKSMARENLADAVLQAKTKHLNKALQKQVFSEEALRALQEPLMTVFLGFGLYAALVWWQMPHGHRPGHGVHAGEGFKNASEGPEGIPVHGDRRKRLLVPDGQKSKKPGRREKAIPAPSPPLSIIRFGLKTSASPMGIGSS